MLTVNTRTGALSDCAKYLNGRGVGARYDGTYNYNGQSSYYIGSCDGKYTGSVSGLDSTYRDNISKFIEAQLDAYEKAAGWIFWTWKTGMLEISIFVSRTKLTIMQRVHPNGTCRHCCRTESSPIPSPTETVSLF